MSFLKDSTLLRHQSYIHGEWVGAQSGKTFPVFNPANNEILAEVADCSAVETESAIAAADAALADWRAKTATVRATQKAPTDYFDSAQRHRGLWLCHH